jgi:hypothetical protein
VFVYGTFKMLSALVELKLQLQLKHFDKICTHSVFHFEVLDPLIASVQMLNAELMSKTPEDTTFPSFVPPLFHQQ